MEVYKMLPEGTLAELIEGSIYMSPSPNTTHQRVVRNLSVQLHAFVASGNLGEVFFSPYDVFLDEELNAVQPDIVFVSNEKKDIVHQDAIHGVPDLIIEVLSPGNTNHDCKIKKDLYQKFGVKEYWIVDAETKEATGYFLDTCYSEGVKHSSNIRSDLLNHEFGF